MFKHQTFSHVRNGNAYEKYGGTDLTATVQTRTELDKQI